MGSAPESGVDELAAMPLAAIGPAGLAPGLVDAEILVADRWRRELRHDDGDVAGPRDHRIGSVGLALKRGVRMRVNVRHDTKLAHPAHLPKLAERIRSQYAHAAGVGGRIEIVIVDDIHGGAPAVMLMAE